MHNVSNTLPYTYTIGLTNVWTKNFESIIVEPPDWYYDRHRHDHSLVEVGFLNIFNNNIASVINEINDSNSSGGGYSGGSFSGGGGGGMGGGSW